MDITLAGVSLTWLLIRAGGIAAWISLSAVVLVGLAMRTRSTSLAPVKALAVHQWLGITTIAALSVHLLPLLVDPVITYSPAQILIPGLSDWQRLPVAAGTVALWMILVVSVLGRVKARLGKKGNKIFSKAHLISYAAWPLATAHYILAGTDALTWVAMSGIALVSAGIAYLLVVRGWVPRHKLHTRRTAASPQGAQEQ